MIGNIRSAFNDLLEEITWMDDATKNVAREKAAAITEKIGYPEYIMNNTALAEDYEGVCHYYTAGFVLLLWDFLYPILIIHDRRFYHLGMTP